MSITNYTGWCFFVFVLPLSVLGQNRHSDQTQLNGSGDSHSFSEEQTSGYICEDLKNTYQIQIINTRNEIAIPNNICNIIRENRQKKEVYYYRINDFAIVKILPETHINKTELPVIDDYVHQNDERINLENR